MGRVGKYIIVVGISKSRARFILLVGELSLDLYNTSW